MAVRYRYTTSQGTVVDRRLIIPSSPDEELRGELYAQEDIDWLHRSEQDQIAQAIVRAQALEDARAANENRKPETITLEGYEVVAAKVGGGDE